MKWVLIIIVLGVAYYFYSGGSTNIPSIQLPFGFGMREIVILLVVLIPIIIVYSLGNARGGGRGGPPRKGPPPSK